MMNDVKINKSFKCYFTLFLNSSNILILDKNECNVVTGCNGDYFNIYPKNDEKLSKYRRK